MELSIYQIDAFADEVFKGNPAAICPLDEWLPDETLQKIAAENNLSETAYFVLDAQTNEYHIRWFTPLYEVDLCGHATLAAAYVIFENLSHEADEIIFQSQSGKLIVWKNHDNYVLNFPQTIIKHCVTPSEISEAFGDECASRIIETWQCDDYMVVLDSEQAVLALQPDLKKLAQLNCRGICVTAKSEVESDNTDFVSRFFAPRHGINEDPVTGSAHCYLTPYWAEKLQCNKLTAKQLSERGGDLFCKLAGDRVLISGKAVQYLEGKIFIVQ